MGVRPRPSEPLDDRAGSPDQGITCHVPSSPPARRPPPRPRRRHPRRHRRRARRRPLASAAPTVAPATPVVTGGAFVPVAASRVIDTRSGYGVPKAKLGPRASLTSSLAGRSGLPAAAGSMSAVVLNLTATNATAATYLTAYAGGATPPGTSSLNVPGGVTVANLVTVPVSSDGRISVVNQAGSTDVIADVVGYYATADNASYGGLQPITPGRLFDSRTQGGAFFSGDYVDLPFSFDDTSLNPDVTAFVATVTAVSPTNAGYFTAWDGTGTTPNTSSVNFRPGVTVANLVEVQRGDYTDDSTTPATTYPSFRVAANVAGSGQADMLVDVLGVYMKPGTGTDARFVPLASPIRIVDTRGAQRPNLAPNATRMFRRLGRRDVPDGGSRGQPHGGRVDLAHLRHRLRPRRRASGGQQHQRRQGLRRGQRGPHRRLAGQRLGGHVRRLQLGRDDAVPRRRHRHLRGLGRHGRGRHPGGGRAGSHPGQGRAPLTARRSTRHPTGTTTGPARTRRPGRRPRAVGRSRARPFGGGEVSRSGTSAPGDDLRRASPPGPCLHSAWPPTGGHRAGTRPPSPELRLDRPGGSPTHVPSRAPARRPSPRPRRRHPRRHRRRARRRPARLGRAERRHRHRRTGGAFVPVAASRVIDTRSGYGVHKGKLGPKASLTSSLAGRSGLPAAAGSMSAVVLNLTATNATAATYLTAYAGGATVPGTSSLNVPGGVTVANLVTVPVSADGHVSIANQAGATDVIADVVGYYATAENASYGGLTPLAPGRLFDSRTDGGAFGSGGYVDIPFSFDDTTLNPDITAFAVTVTAVNPTNSGYFTAWDSTGSTPNTSSLNFRPGVTVANLVEVQRGDVYDADNNLLPGFRVAADVAGDGQVDMLVDVVGVYTKPGTLADARFVPLATPKRLIDTRGAQRPNLAPNATRTFSAGTLGTSSTVALAANLTVAGSTSPTYLTTYAADGTSRPGISSINAGKGAVVANAALLELPSNTTLPRSFNVFNSGGTTPFLVDVAGTFEAPVTPAARAAVAAAPSVSPAGAVRH